MRRLVLLGLAMGCAASVAPERTVSFRALAERVEGEPTLSSEDGPLELESMRLDAEVVSGIVSASLELVFKNDLAKVLEGQLLVPLPEGAVLDGFALDVGGVLREGTLVERERARVAFESVERRGVDPGLVEWSHGSTFRTRVYPIPAHGTRRARIRFSEEVGSRLVLDFGPRLTGRVRIGDAVSVVNGKVALDLGALREPEGSVDARGAFMARIPVGEPRDVPLPPRVTVIDDVSLAALGRDREKEVAVLERALQGVAEVRLVTFAHEVFAVERVASVSDLVVRIDSAMLDGAARLSCLDLAKLEAETDAFLVLSDGVAALGTAAVPGQKRTICLTSGPGADFAALERLGTVVNLRELGVDAAVKRVRSLPRTVTVSGADESYAGDARGEVLTVAGRLAAGVSEVEVSVREGELSRSFHVPLASAEGASRVVARRRIERLLQARPIDVAAVVSLAKAERIATPFTSFVVLETPEDYRRYGIESSDLVAINRRLRDGIEYLQTDKFRKAMDVFEAVVKEDPGNEQAQKFLQLASEGKHWQGDAAQYNENKLEMQWNVENSEVEPNIYTPTNKVVMFPEDFYWRQEVQRRGVGLSTRSDDTGFFQTRPNAAIREDQVGYNFASRSGTDPRIAAILDGTLRHREVVEGQVARLTQLRADLDADRAALGTPNIPRRAPFRHYAEGIAALASATDLDGIYLHVRHMAPAFFADAAEVYVARGQRARAVRVLTNLAALDPGDPTLLRVLADRLEEIHENGLALEVLERVAALRPEEPQSFRDLALLQADTANVPSAVANLERVEKGHWDGRFPGIDKIAARERAHLLHPDANPLDLRVVITWDSDATDVDLWVTDPSGEKVIYNHPTSRAGGHLSADITRGYGPEEFVLEHAPKGEYLIEAQFYGDSRATRVTDTTLKATIETHYGSKEESRQTVVRRMTERKEIVEIGRVNMR